MVLIRGEGEIRDQRKREYAQGKYLGISVMCHELNKYYHGRPDTQQADGDERQFFCVEQTCQEIHADDGQSKQEDIGEPQGK